MSVAILGLCLNTAGAVTWLLVGSFLRRNGERLLGTLFFANAGLSAIGMGLAGAALLLGSGQ